MKSRQLFLGVALAFCGGCAALANPLTAGAGKSDMTPPASAFPYVVPREKPFVGVHDPLFARALVLDDGATRTVMVALEVTSIPEADKVVAAVAEAAQVPVANVIVTATHTHNNPLVFWRGPASNPTQTAMIAQVREAAVKAVRDAMAARQPARIAFTRTRAHANVNNGEEAGLETWADPEGSSDKSLDIVRVTDLVGKPLALMLNYASHGEVMYRAVTKDGGYEVTGDLPGAVSALLEAQAGGAPVVLFTPAAEADQLSLFKALQPKAQLPETDIGAAGWGLLELLARRVAAAALDGAAAAGPGRADVAIRVTSGALTCPGQKYNVERPSGKVLGINPAPDVTIKLNVVRIDDVALAGIGADIASDIGKAIKAASPARQTTLVTMTGNSAGYVLNDKAYLNPGHGALGSPVKPGCAPVQLPRVVSRLVGRR
jgi:hypothetical protein